MDEQENAKKLLELSLRTSSSSSSEDGRSRQGAKTPPPPRAGELFSPNSEQLRKQWGRAEYEVSLAKEIENSKARDQLKTLSGASEIIEQSLTSQSPTELAGRALERATNSPSISDNLSDTPSEVQRKIREGQSVTAIELAQENERLKALLAESRRTIDLEKVKNRDMEIQLIETQAQKETSSEQVRVRPEERIERTRIRSHGTGRVSFNDPSPGRLSEGSRHSAGS